MSGCLRYMAKFRIDIPDSMNKMIDNLQKCSKDSEKIIKKAVYQGAKIVGDAIDARIPEDSGDLRKSFYLAKMENENGYIHTETGFADYDSRGVPNALKANVLESGSSKVKKHPFIRPAINASKGQCVQAMQDTLIKEINNLFE